MTNKIKTLTFMHGNKKGITGKTEVPAHEKKKRGETLAAFLKRAGTYTTVREA